MHGATALEQLRWIGSELEGIDLDCYRRHGRDPKEPVLGLGNAQARWCFFGRDPGEQEVRLQRPFVGGAGQKIRAVMAELAWSDDDIYWMNTVPFKPIGNKPWPVAVRRRCRPALLQLLASWRGVSVVTFGEAAFKWFGMGSPETRRTIEEFWARADKYDASLQVDLEIAGAERRFTLHPVPHPSGANAVWAAQFPDLLKARLCSGARAT
ncbi:uracil-DNA glycosylase family protein [Ramlibacter sp. AN1015]|uniref:uracil-DNA glycosylase family protein n=1 Tax=Ramlibacter sp. AN1015 TaxID=3133428 RepID=UPI0030C4CFF2